MLRAPSTTSRKHLTLRLIPEGKRLLKKAERPASEAYEQLMSPFDASQREQLIALLQLLSDNLGQQTRAALVRPGN